MEDERLRPIALHARRLAFMHPTTHTPVTIEAPRPRVASADARAGSLTLGGDKDFRTETIDIAGRLL